MSEAALATANPERLLGIMRRSDKLRSVLLRDPCVYCGRRSSYMTIDHVSARSKGSKSAGLANGAPACFDCNQRKGDVYDDNATDILLIEASDFDDKIWVSEETVLLSDNPYAVTEANFIFTQTFDLILQTSPDAIEITVNLTVTSNGNLDALVSAFNAAVWFWLRVAISRSLAVS